MGTGLGMLGYESMEAVLDARPASMASISPLVWQQLGDAFRGGAHRRDFEDAWRNGEIFLSAADGLRGRRPLLVEWKGGQRAAGDETVPVDLRVDHVFLISCKYRSHILHNSSPRQLFEHLLAPGGAARSTDWFTVAAPTEYQRLYTAVRQRLAAPGPDTDRPATDHGDGPRQAGAPGPLLPAPAPGQLLPQAVARHQPPPVRRVDPLADLPSSVTDLSVEQRRALGARLRGGWPEGVEPLVSELTGAVARLSAHLWRRAMHSPATREAMLWRLLRIGSAPYFVLGAGPDGPLRLRVATPWDWRRQFRLRELIVLPQTGGQARVGWQALVSDRNSATDVSVKGHVEVRWSHGRFAQPPEAKVYLDTPHREVPGYFALD